MALPTTTPGSWLRSMDFPSRILETGNDDYELYEEDDERNQRRTYHRRFRFPKRVDDGDIAAQYRNGIREVWRPVREGQ